MLEPFAGLRERVKELLPGPEQVLSTSKQLLPRSKQSLPRSKHSSYAGSGKYDVNRPRIADPRTAEGNTEVTERIRLLDAA